MNCTIKTGDFCKTLHLILPYPSGKAKQASYTMTMTFGRMSEPLTKVQKVESTKTAQSYDFTYKYEDSNHPTAPTQIGHEHYTYDANGNPTLVENDSLNTERRMYWDEDNRLMVLSDNGKTSRYTYNAAGERIVKSHGDLEGVYVNGAPQGLTFHETEDYTIYPAPIITVTKNRFTKHYFVGDKRIASKLGTGKFSNVYGISSSNVTAGQKDYAARMLQIEKQREEYYRKLGTPPGVPTMKGATADPDNTGYGYNTIIGELGDHSVPEGWVQRPKFNKKGDVPGPPIQWNKPEDPDNAQPGYGYVPADTTNTEEIFFYHSDHLGSTSYITDAKANITQFDAYLPYGELLVDEHSSSEDMPYKFNGKEFDQETGLYYYGARYMNPVTSLWYGVDPLAEKYPSVGGYVYCVGNPVRFLDLDGRKVWLGTDENSLTSLDLIRGTLPENERSFIQIDKKGYINQEIIESGLNESSSTNFKDLVTIVRDPRTIKYYGLSSGANMQYDETNMANFTKTFIGFDSPTHGSTVDLLIRQALDRDKNLNADDMRNLYVSQGFSESYRVTGNMGITLRPDNEQGAYPNKNKRSISSYIEVYTSNVGTTKLDQYANAGHEFYNHVLFYLQGKDPTHLNPELNSHSSRVLHDIYKYHPKLLKSDMIKFK